ncbi:MAG: DUF3883 domain-containing protein [Albidovulum sp.]|nr:DUF3883 domain-containing protein [Albidovulum sp.]
MAGDSWTDEQNDLIVSDYFAMLDDDLASRPYNKSKHNKALQVRIGRSHGSIEYKHQNISAILQSLGQPWIPGYKPAINFQASLIDAVLRQLEIRSRYHLTPELLNSAMDLEAPAELLVGPPPTLGNSPPPEDLYHMLAVARKFDAAGRDERNRDLGRAGEMRALAHEKATLLAAGRSDLAERVKWVSEEEGDGAGYDIESFSPEGRSRLIEVKATNLWERTPFYLTRNELAVAEGMPDEWCLLRLWNFARDPRAFELRPPLNAHVTLIATNYEARLR